MNIGFCLPGVDSLNLLIAAFYDGSQCVMALAGLSLLCHAWNLPRERNNYTG